MGPGIVHRHRCRQDSERSRQPDNNRVAFLNQCIPTGEETGNGIHHNRNAVQHATGNGQPRADYRQHDFADLQTDILKQVPHFGRLLHGIPGIAERGGGFLGGVRHVVHGFPELFRVGHQDGKGGFSFLIHQPELFQKG